MSPEGEFFDLAGVPSWVQYRLACGSLKHAIEETNKQKDDPDGPRTLMVQLTVADVSLVTTALLILLRVFPEFKQHAIDLSLKFSDLADAQDFLSGLGGDTP